jgi:hypothetical protein
MRAIIAGTTLACLCVSQASAAYDCGRHMRAVFGIADSAYNMALKWADFTRTTAQPGAVVVQTRKGKASDGKSPGGHVSKIVRVLDTCHAIVNDDRGTRKRDICRNLVAYVLPNPSTESKSVAKHSHTKIRSQLRKRIKFSKAAAATRPTLPDDHP